MLDFFLNIINNLRYDYNEYKDEIIEETIIFQKRTFKYNIFISVMYMLSMILAKLELEDLYVHLVISTVCVVISSINYYIFSNFMHRYKDKAIIIANIYIILILTIFLLVDVFFSTTVSYTVIFGGIFITAISNLTPVLYSIILLSTVFLNTTMHFIVNYHKYSSFYLLIFDNIITIIMFVYVNYTISNVKYEKFKYIKELKKESNTDFLTKLLNRRYIENYIYSQAKYKEKSAMILIDLDNFKPVNDVFGHKKGDELLVNVSDMIRESFSKNDCIARLGGDEFLIYVPKIEDATVIVNKVENFIKKFPIVLNYDNNDIKVSASVGIAISKTDEKDLYEELYKRADEAMYKAKHSGKGKYYISN